MIAEHEMKLVVGLGSIDDYISFSEAGADECFAGYVPEMWMERFPNSALNRREVRYYNVQIGSMSELLILREMIRCLKVPVTIALNALRFSEEERALGLEIAAGLSEFGYSEFIAADGEFATQLAADLKCKVHLSGEYGELNHLILNKMAHIGITRIIFPRQTTVDEMESMIRHFPDLEYEAFLFNEKCHFTGAYCNSLHCDELCHACRIPYRLDDEGMKIAAAFKGKPYEEHISEYSQSDSCHSCPDDDMLADIPGSTGCGLCLLWEYRKIGITHLKLVSRGNDTESTLRDIKVIRRALNILRESHSEEEYQQKMKAEIFPGGCSGNCYL